MRSDCTPIRKCSMYSAEPDLRVSITDRDDSRSRALAEIVEVHSQVLMIASPVWRSMLTSNMIEGFSGTVTMIGKDSEEFKLIYRTLHTTATSKALV